MEGRSTKKRTAAAPELNLASPMAPGRAWAHRGSFSLDPDDQYALTYGGQDADGLVLGSGIDSDLEDELSSTKLGSAHALKPDFGLGIHDSLSASSLPHRLPNLDDAPVVTSADETLEEDVSALTFDGSLAAPFESPRFARGLQRSPQISPQKSRESSPSRFSLGLAAPRFDPPSESSSSASLRAVVSPRPSISMQTPSPLPEPEARDAQLGEEVGSPSPVSEHQISEHGPSTPSKAGMPSQPGAQSCAQSATHPGAQPSTQSGAQSAIEPSTQSAAQSVTQPSKQPSTPSHSGTPKSALKSPGTPGTPGTPSGSRSVSFASAPPPHASNHRKNNSSASHIEFHQDALGNVEKRYIGEDGETLSGAEESESSWQAMPTVGSYEVYDDNNNLVRETFDSVVKSEHENAAASGYSRVANNDDAASVTSLDDRTDYLFDHHKVTDEVDAGFQMGATKSMLTDQQKIAYAGLCRLCIAEMALQYSQLGKRVSQRAIEALQVWGRGVIMALYTHLNLSLEEQGMIESLAAHNLLAADLTPCLRQIQKVETSGQIMAEEFSDDDDMDVNDFHEELPQLDKTIEVDVKWTVMCDFFLILLSMGTYDARSRTLLTLVAAKLDVTTKEVAQFERKVTDVLQIDDDGEQDWTEKDIIEHRRRKALRRKYAYVGLATVGGGLVIGLSAGLLAPFVGMGVAGALGTIGITGTSGFFAGTGGIALITSASTAIGMGVGHRSMMKRAGHVKTFEFRPVFNNNRVNVLITIGGWMTGKDDDVRLPFSTIDPVMGDVLSVYWEPEMMRSLGQTMNILATEALAFGVQQVLAATVFTALFSSLQAPLWLAKLSYLVDNPWSVSLDRAWASGRILADNLMKRKLGNRPATLIGYGLGARMIYSCLSELAHNKAFGLVQDVYMFGTPVFYQKKDFAKVRAMVSGRWVNGFSRKDWILAFLFPGAKRYGMVLGLDSLPEQDTAQFYVENVDVSAEVDGHMNYRSKMPKLMKMCGIEVLSEEFDEIEDPDPEKLRDKQRKLLGELNTVDKPKKTSFFSSWKFDWMQRANSKASTAPGSPLDSEHGEYSADQNAAAEPNGGTLIFDADAIRNELATLKPRMQYEQELAPLPEHDKTNMPLEVLQYVEDPVKPTAAIDYDDPTSPKPPAYTPRRNAPEGELDSKLQLQFDDLE